LSSNRFAFIEFSSHTEAQNALKLNFSSIGGRKIRVQFAKERVHTPAQPSDEKLATFQAITGLSAEESYHFLIQAKWNVEVT
jgi:RNA recognition motif-containing protein